MNEKTNNYEQHMDKFCSAAIDSQAFLTILIMRKYVNSDEWFEKLKEFCIFLIEGEEEIRIDAAKDGVLIPPLFAADKDKQDILDALIDFIAIALLRFGSLDKNGLETIINIINQGEIETIYHK